MDDPCSAAPESSHPDLLLQFFLPAGQSVFSLSRMYDAHLEGFDQSLLINESSPGSVDYAGGGPHLGQKAPGNDALCRWVQTCTPSIKTL